MTRRTPPPAFLSRLFSFILLPLAAAQQSPLQISPDGTCGNGVTCAGSTWGECCSPHFYCGSDDAYCGSGCNPSFGICSSSGGTGTSPAQPSASAGVDGVEVTVTVTETVRSTSVAVRTSTIMSTRTSVVTSISVVTSVSYVTSARDAACVGGGSGGRSTEGVGTTTIRAGGGGGSTAAAPGPTLPGVVSNCKFASLLVILVGRGGEGWVPVRREDKGAKRKRPNGIENMTESIQKNRIQTTRDRRPHSSPGS